MAPFQGPAKTEILDLELILCTRQPGNLYISRHACALRYLKAQKIKFHPFGSAASVVNRSFEICQACTDGRRYAEEISSFHSKQ
jgi:hypothetical protein